VYFINFCYHEDDSGSVAEKQFFATSHEKGAYDGAGEQLKGKQERKVYKTLKGANHELQE
jgi:hypothetical protein